MWSSLSVSFLATLVDDLDTLAVFLPVCNTSTNVAIMPTAQDQTIVGQVGARVAANLKQLRGAMPVRELARRLEELGRPIDASGITKIEKGKRRVDVDDLVALAVALNVSPNALLLPERLPPGADGDVQLTPSVVVPSWRDAWAWACGERPLPLDEESRLLGPELEEAYEFQRRNRPHTTPDFLVLENGAGPLKLTLHAYVHGLLEWHAERAESEPKRDLFSSALPLLDEMRRTIEAIVARTRRESETLTTWRASRSARTVPGGPATATPKAKNTRSTPRRKPKPNAG
jgi:hypothetical protein